jgi:hypothetical protein
MMIHLYASKEKHIMPKRYFMCTWSVLLQNHKLIGLQRRRRCFWMK